MGALLSADFTHSAGLPDHRRCSTRWSRSTSSCWCPSTCCASSPSSSRAWSTASRCAATNTSRPQGAALLVCNHVSFVDADPADGGEPAADPLHHGPASIFRMPVLGWFFKLAKAIPIAPQREDPGTYELAFEKARAVLADGELLCIFPEGAITRDGELGEFKGGVMKLLESNPVPVVPLALQNLWGSYFSRVDGAAMKQAVPPRLVQPRRAGGGRCDRAGRGHAGRAARTGREPARLVRLRRAACGRAVRIPRSPARRTAAAWRRSPG